VSLGAKPGAKALPASRYTVGQAIEDWLREGLDGRSEKTITLYQLPDHGGCLSPRAAVSDHHRRRGHGQDLFGLAEP
jgi:hypothetical protein